MTRFLGFKTAISISLMLFLQSAFADDANNFSDALTDSNHSNYLSFDVPFKYGYSPIGLLRIQSNNAIDRPMVRTIASNFNEADSFTAEMDISGNTLPPGDLIWFGYGVGNPVDGFNEPGNYVGFRIHSGNFDGWANFVNTTVRVGAQFQQVNTIDQWPQLGAKFRIERVGNSVILAINGAVVANYDISNLNNNLNSNNSFIFFGNTHQSGIIPTAFKNLSISATFPSLDSDNDGVNDDLDACPETPAGTEVDEVGCPVPQDDDGDGVENDHDICPATPEGAIVNANGCSGAQAIELVCPSSGEQAVYRNHGSYVSCVSKAADAAVLDGLLTDEEADAIVSAAAQSSVGKPAKSGKK